MRCVYQFLHHRSLTVSIIALFLALVPLGFLPEHAFRLQQQGAAYLRSAGIIAALDVLSCAFALIILVKDNRSGYPSYRCSLATLLWALACVPVILLIVVVIGDLLR
jgi:hypothetical protein